MERFCGKCGTLVTGDGMFCPNCGARLDSVVDLSKPNMTSNSVQSQYSDPIPTPLRTNSTYSGTSPNYNTAANMQSGSTVSSQTMTLGQWVGTILLCTCLGIVSIVLMFVWGFSDNTPPEKKNFCRAYLIVTAIGIGVSIIIAVGMVACVGGLSGIMGDYYYY